MRELNTFKGVAAALREAESMRERGEVQKVLFDWIDLDMKPTGVCACGGVALVSGLDTTVHPCHGNKILEAFPIMGMEVVDPSDNTSDTLLNTMSWLNYLGWPWNEIANWLESLDVGG